MKTLCFIAFTASSLLLGTRITHDNLKKVSVTFGSIPSGFEVGKGYLHAPAARLNVETKDGKTFFALRACSKGGGLRSASTAKNEAKNFHPNCGEAFEKELDILSSVEHDDLIVKEIANRAFCFKVAADLRPGALPPREKAQHFLSIRAAEKHVRCP